MPNDRDGANELDDMVDIRDMDDVSVQRFVAHLEREFDTSQSVTRMGRVFEVVGTLVKASGLDVGMGELCRLTDASGSFIQQAEVVGFDRRGALLSPFGSMAGINRSTLVVPTGKSLMVPVGEEVLGRVLSGLGTPMDCQGPLNARQFRPVYCDPPDPMSREVMDQPLPTGVKIIDGLATLAEGQRMGIFSPAGVGKSTLLGMLARGAQCDVSVIALIGERGREVREFIEHILGPEGMARSVVVCATSDRSSIERAKAAHVATAIAEHFRDTGKRVLLMMDSLTRFARALREIGLAAGETPARRGFPPSVFAELPRLLERTGTGPRGSITALYTVLAEDDSSADPIAEEVRGILDGHLILSRKIAAKSQYPAIDALGSLSRVMPQVVSPEHARSADALRMLMAKYEEVEMLLQVGEYRQGADPVADLAVHRIGDIRAFLHQHTSQLHGYDEILAQLQRLVQ